MANKTNRTPAVPLAKRRVSIELSPMLAAQLEEARELTGLGLPELGRIGLIKILNELRQKGRIATEMMPRATAMLAA